MRAHEALRFRHAAFVALVMKALLDVTVMSPLAIVSSVPTASFTGTSFASKGQGPLVEPARRK